MRLPPLRAAASPVSKNGLTSDMIHDAVFLTTLVVVWLGPAVLVAKLAQGRGRDFTTFLLVSLIVPWPLMLLIVLVLPGREGSSASNDD